MDSEDDPDRHVAVREVIDRDMLCPPKAVESRHAFLAETACTKNFFTLIFKKKKKNQILLNVINIIVVVKILSNNIIKRSLPVIIYF